MKAFLASTAVFVLSFLVTSHDAEARRFYNVPFEVSVTYNTPFGGEELAQSEENYLLYSDDAEYCVLVMGKLRSENIIAECKIEFTKKKMGLRVNYTHVTFEAPFVLVIEEALSEAKAWQKYEEELSRFFKDELLEKWKEVRLSTRYFTSDLEMRYSATKQSALIDAFYLDNAGLQKVVRQQHHSSNINESLHIELKFGPATESK